MFLALAPGITFSHGGHSHETPIYETEFALTVNEISQRINLSENTECIINLSLNCDCCYDGICYDSEHKCGLYGCNSDEPNCMHHCSQNESRSIPPINLISLPEIKLSLIKNNIKINTDITIFTPIPTVNLYTISTPTYISIRALLI